jgi:hypothetical protein
VAYDVVIKNGRVMDPESGFDGYADVGLIGDRIAKLSEPGLIAGRRVIDASGLVVAPGFIDNTVPFGPEPAKDIYKSVEYWKLQDGVTTTLWLHSGAEFPASRIAAMRGKTHLTNWGMGIVASYFLLQKEKPLAERLELLRGSIEGGGLCIGVNPEYTPALTTEEMAAAMKLADEYGLWMGIHLRYAHMDSEQKGVEEAVRMTELSGGHLHIFHLPSTGGTYHMDATLEKLEAARARGLRITACAYPFSFWMTFINAANRFAPGWQEGLGLRYEDLWYVPTGEYLTESTFKKYRPQGGLIVVPEGTISVEKSILPAYAKDWIWVGSDGCYDEPWKQWDKAMHPRDTGTFAAALAFAREHGIPLMTMLRKMTLDPARNLESACAEFKERGRLQEGMYADITVFDPETVNYSGTVRKPAVESKGIACVIVNGAVRYTAEGGVEGADNGRLLDRVNR